MKRKTTDDVLKQKRASKISIETCRVHNIDVCDINGVRYVSFGRCINGLALQCRRHFFKAYDFVDVFDLSYNKNLKLVRLDALLQDSMRHYISTHRPAASGGKSFFISGEHLLNCLIELTKIKLDDKHCVSIPNRDFDFACGLGEEYLRFRKDLTSSHNETSKTFNAEEFGKNSHNDLSQVFKNIAEYVSISSAEGKFEGGTLSKDTFKYLSALNLVVLVADAMERNVFEDVKDMQSRVNMFLSAMRTCFDVETTDMVIKDNEDDDNKY